MTAAPVELHVISDATGATATRLMGLDPKNIVYIAAPQTSRIGPIAERQVDQRGEPWRTVVCDFEYPNHPHYNAFKGIGNRSQSAGPGP